MSIGILGGGLTGLTIAANLKLPYEILEKEALPGGLCRSLNEQGFIFDFGGGHAIFSRDEDILNKMLKVLGENRLRPRRNAKVLYKGRYVKYPFENGLSDLPLEENCECLISYLKNDYPLPVDFQSWIYYTFGRGIAEKYLIPYNQKIWNISPDRMSLSWVDGRIPKPPVEDLIKSSLGICTEGYTHQLHFYYPARGGIAGYIVDLSKSVKDLTTNFTVQKIRRRDGRWIVQGPRGVKEFERIVSTIPVFDLIAALDDVPDEIKLALSQLRYNSLVTVMLGYQTENLSDITWLYVPDSKIWFHKISFPKNYSPQTVPAGCSSVMTEATCQYEDQVWKKSDQETIRQTANDLDGLGITAGKKRIFARVMRSQYAYVVNTHSYQENINKITSFLTSLGIDICGRFAEFKYLNMDACTRRALQMAEYLNAVCEKERMA